MTTADHAQSHQSEWLPPDAITDGFARQGDVLLLKKPEDDIGHVNYGLVITADCDTVQHKTSGYVSYVPVISLPEYFYRFWLPEYVEAKGHAKRCLEGLRKTVLERMQQYMPDAKPLSDTALFRLAVDGLSGPLAEPDSDKKRSKRFESDLVATRSLKVLRERSVRPSIKDLHEHGSAFASAIGLGSLDKLVAKGADTLKDAVTGSGSVDIFPVSHVAHADASPHVVMLRFVRSLPEPLVTTSMAEFKFGEKLGCRIGRMRHEVKYDCMQRFGRLFLRAGKPDSINDVCRDRIEVAMKSLVGGGE